MQCADKVTTLYIDATANTIVGRSSISQHIQVCSHLADAFQRLYSKHKSEFCPPFQHVDTQDIPTIPMWECDFSGNNKTITVYSTVDGIGSCIDDAINSKCTLLHPSDDGGGSALFYFAIVLGALLITACVHRLSSVSRDGPDSEPLVIKKKLPCGQRVSHVFKSYINLNFFNKQFKDDDKAKSKPYESVNKKTMLELT